MWNDRALTATSLAGREGGEDCPKHGKRNGFPGNDTWSVSPPDAPLLMASLKQMGLNYLAHTQGTNRKSRTLHGHSCSE